MRVADELVAEFADPNSNIGSPDPDNPNTQQYDEKNIRRRVYDALNVLMAMDIISKDKKEIQWKGLPRTSLSDIDKLKTEVIGLKGRIDKKSAYLQELQDQSEMSSYMVREMLHLAEWPCHSYWFRHVLMQLSKWRYQKICSWCILISIALRLSCTMIPLY
uniref:E2F/DP family winged-helix DNA-binding domain-containing protein n=1 Tax=Aegilops tauschii subsp. strangulata TaxID=200361 RepID=A0A452YAX6_AEGTS